MGLSILRNFLALWQQLQFSSSVGFDDLKLGSNVLLKIHRPSNTILRSHLVRRVLDVLQLLGGEQHPVVDALQRSVEVLEGAAEVLDDLDLLFKLTNNDKLLLKSSHLLGNDLLLVVRKGDSHDLYVVLDLVVEVMGITLPDDKKKIISLE